MTKKSDALGFFLVLYDWLVIVACAVVAEKFLPNGWWLLMAPIIGSRMMAFASLVHDSSHYLLFKTRWLNEFVGEVFLAWPVGRLLWHFRTYHIIHHNHLRTEKDAEYPLRNYQEFQFPKSNFKLALILLLDLIGINFIIYQIKKIPKLFRSAENPHNVGKNRRYTRARLVLYLAIIFSSIWFDLYLLLIKYWLVPFGTWYAMVFRVRAISEHFSVPKTKSFQTRTILLGALEKFFFFPHNVNYHTEHHLHAGVPCYKLPQLHKTLVTNPSFTDGTHFTVGLRGLVNELTA